MFTGIVQACVPVTRVDRQPGLITYTVALPEDLRRGLEPGASVSIDGVCQTVTRIAGADVTFDAMQETLSATTLGLLVEGAQVNVERSAAMGDEIGGHVLSGHVIGTAEIVAVRDSENNHAKTFRVPSAWMKYVFPKGFIALDGASLTLARVDKQSSTFEVWFIPETMKRTTLGFKRTGARVNVEIDSRTQVIVDTVERVLGEMALIPPRA
jgi:riboflavin synthase